MSSITSSRALRLTLAMSVLLAAACSNDGPVAPKVLPTLPGASGTVRVEIQRDLSVGGDSALFIVRVIATATPMAAYQGSVTFSPGALHVLSISTPAVAGGEFRIANDREAGRIRFAGFAPDAFSGTEAFRFVARLTDALSAADLAGSLDVAGQPGGNALGRALLKRSDGIHDAVTNQLLTP